MAWGDSDEYRDESTILEEIPSTLERVRSDGEPGHGYVRHQTLRDLVKTLYEIAARPAPVDYRSEFVDIVRQEWQPDRFAESNEQEVFALAQAEGVTVIKVTGDHGGDVQAAIDAAQVAGPGSIVWFDAPYDSEEGGILQVPDGNPIRIFGYSRDPSQTKIKRAVGASHAAILKVVCGATMAAALDADDKGLRANRLLIRDLELDGQAGAAALFGFHFYNNSAPAKHVTLENIVSHDCTTYGFNLEGLSGGTMVDYVYDTCVSYNCGSGWKHDSGALWGLQFVNCKGYNNRVTGAYLRNYNQRDLLMSRCVWGYNGEYGVLFEEINDPNNRSVIEDCRFYSNGWSFNLPPAGPVANPAGLHFYNSVSDDSYDGVTVRRCSFLRDGEWQPFVADNGRDHGSGIKFKLKALAQNVTIEDCDFDGCGHFGIHLHSRDGYSGAQFKDILIHRCNFRGHKLAGVGADNMSGTACDVTAVDCWWNGPDGAADEPRESGYAPGEYTGAGHGATGQADAVLSSTPFGYKRETNEGETRYPVTVEVTY